MTAQPPQPLRITWLAPDDYGGGVVSVAQACCRQAALAGHTATLLLALPPKGHAAEFGGFRLCSLDSEPPHADIPVRLARWLAENPQDVIVLNGCEQADVAIPYVTQSTRLLYVVHDTAKRYFAAALQYEDELDAIIAVSQSVADRFSKRLRHPRKLHVVLNGTVFPHQAEVLPARERSDDLIFLGGDKPMKGAFDVLTLWTVLLNKGFAGRLHWFGEVSPALRVSIGKLPEAQRIVVYGRQPRTAIFAAAARAKVTLMLSRVESFGMATVECMGMGCLPVAWDVPTGTKEIVAEDEGAFAPLGDFNALADAVIRSIDRNACFGASSKRIRAVFSEEAMWSRYGALIEQLFKVPTVSRPMAGQHPPTYSPPVRFYQWLPPRVRFAIGAAIGRWPRLGYALRGLRGR